MHPIQRYVYENIYASPKQDKQFHFTLNNVLRFDGVALREVNVYRRYKKRLPDDNNFYRVYAIGNLSPHFLNLLTQYKLWFRDVWVSMQDDANRRNFIFQLHTKEGVVAPSSHVYYNFIDESSLLIAVKYDRNLSERFKDLRFNYLRVYSNYYFSTEEFSSLPVRHGISKRTFIIPPNGSMTQVTNYINNLKSAGGDVVIYHNGCYVPRIPSSVRMNDFVDVIYDQSILSVERYSYKELMPFGSVRDGRKKLALFRDSDDHRSFFKDDIDIYLLNKGDNATNIGVYFYKHRDFVVRNITNKDFSLDGYYLGNQLLMLEDMTGVRGEDKHLDVIIRYGHTNMDLVHNEIKLNELYKLPIEKLKSLMTNTVYTESTYRAERLENSTYFELMGAKDVKHITLENSVKALGYCAITSLYGKSYHTDNEIEVPLLYRTEGRAYEYNNGRYIKNQSISSDTYSKENEVVVLTQDYDTTLYDVVVYVQTLGYLRFEMNSLPKELEVYLNGRYLAYGIDYVLSGSTIYIQNFEYIELTEANNLHIRAYGVASDVSEVNEYYDIGFVKNGLVSYNGRYNIRDDRPHTVYVNGLLMDPEDVRYQDELDEGDLNSPLNGRPYTVTDRYLSIDESTGLDHSADYALSRERDRVLEGVLSLWYDLDNDIVNQYINQKYRLTSNLLLSIIRGIRNNDIPETYYLDSNGEPILEPSKYMDLLNRPEYIDLLEVDVIFQDLPFDILEIKLSHSLNPVNIGDEAKTWLSGLIDFMMHGRSRDHINLGL